MRAIRVVAIIAGLLLLGVVVALLVPPSPSVDGLPPGFAAKRFETGEVTLSYVEGPARGPPLVLIPGQMESWQGYRLVMEQLAEQHHVFVIELRGHGGSSRTPGHYSYVACGEDVQRFLESVVQEPAFVSGLSSGGMIAAWVAANAPKQVRGAVLEDPPIFSSLWPRIRDERYMSRLFQIAIDELGDPGGPDLEGYLGEMGAPKPGSDEVQKIASGFVKLVGRLFSFAKWLRPEHPWDAPLLPYSMRAGAKFLTEYDVDFSAATLDGRLSAGFDADATLSAIECPVLYLHASWSRHESWGLLGAADDRDVERVKTLVKQLQVVELTSAHEIHLSKPELYLREVGAFLAAH